MPRNGHSKLWLPAGAILIVVVLACGIWWFRQSDPGPATATATPSASVENALPDKAGRAEPAETGSIPPARTAAEATNPTGVASLRIHVIDAFTGAPVGGAKCFVETTSGDAHDFGSIETDADGAGTVSELPAATLVVHVLRKPPHASGYTAVELHAGESRDVEVRLTAGGTLVGRAVDDATQPVADAEVSINSDRDDLMTFGGSESWVVVTRTGPDGRFEIPNVLSRPVRVSIVDGEMHAQIWASVSVNVQSGSTRGSARSAVADGARVDLGDIVLPRGRTFSGHVLDAHRAPVEGVLVELARVPEKPNSTTRSPRTPASTATTDPSTASTKSDGSFRVRADPTFKYVSVTTKEGIFEQFDLPDSNPPPADLELVLKDWSILEIELVDERGSRITTAAPALRDKQARLVAVARRVAADAGQLNLNVVLAGKRQLHAEVVADADGIFRVQTAGNGGDSRRLHLEFPGYLPVDADIGAQSSPLERRKFTLHLLPTLRVHVNIAQQPPPAGAGPKLTLYVQACLLDPATYSSPANLPGKGPAKMPGDKCCGQGSLWTTKLEAGEHEVELPVLAKGNYWIHAEVPATRRNEKDEVETYIAFEQHLGPFAADGTAHAVNVPSVERPPLPEGAKIRPLPAASPGATSVTGRIVDAATQKGIEYASIGLIPVPAPEDALAKFSYQADHDGRLSSKLLPAGRYSMRMYARKYRVPLLDEVTIVDGKTVDLGTMALALLPVTTLHLVEADGRPAPRGTHVDMRGVASTSLVQASVKGDDGKIELQEELSSGVSIRVREDRPGSDVDGMSGIQWLVHDFRPDETAVELRLEKWQLIEVRVNGAIQDFPAAQTWCFVDVPELAASWMWSCHLTEVTAEADGTRVFRGETGGPGKAQVSVWCTLLQPFSQTIDIQDHADVQTFLLTPIR